MCLLWDSLSGSNEFNSGNIIMGGDLNFTLSIAEVWSQNSHHDPLESYFSNLMEKHNLINLVPKKIFHTWRNGRKETCMIEKKARLIFYF
jgi:hypothetical protein